MEPATLTRKERERQQHRGDVLDAAERVFSAKGYHDATIEEIAREAEFAVGTLYNLFKGKDDIYIRVIENVIDKFMLEFEADVLAETDSDTALRNLVRVRLTHFDQHREFIRIAIEAGASRQMDPSNSLPPQLRDVHDRYLEQVAKIFERGIAAGRLEPGTPLYLSLCLEGITNAFMAYWSRSETIPLDQRIALLQEEVIVRFAARSREPAAGGDRAR